MSTLPFDFVVIAMTRPRGFRVLDRSGRAIAEAHQPSIWHRTMQGTAGGVAVRITSEGFWRARFGVYEQSMRIGTISTIARGSLKLSLALRDVAPIELHFGRAGLMRSGYRLGLTPDEPLLELKAVFQWSTFLTDYAVRIKGPGIGAPQLPLVLTLAGFCARYMRSRSNKVPG